MKKQVKLNEQQLINLLCKVLTETSQIDDNIQNDEPYNQDWPDLEVIAEYDGKEIVRRTFKDEDTAFDFGENLINDLRNKGVEVDNPQRFYAGIYTNEEDSDCCGYYNNEDLEPGEKGFWMD